MCIIIDTNALASVFDSKSNDHREFEPVLTWISNGCGIVIYGGTKYNKELKGSEKYRRVLVELQRAGKTLQINCSLVDNEESRLKKLVKKKDFNDPHIVALINVSHCYLLCTKDKRSHKYILDHTLYTGVSRCPAIYTGRRNLPLLSQKYVADICKKTERGNRLRQSLATA